MRMTAAGIVLVTVMLLGCAGAPGAPGGQVIVDRRGVDATQYSRDLAACRSYASQVGVARRAGRDAAVGAAVGAVGGAAAGDSDTAKRGAGVGAVVGGTKGGFRAARERGQVVKRCLRGRGYRVLN